jgi:NTP pyrophosphatase (non-canonical NTP hydrolase)
MQREHRVWLSQNYPNQPPEVPAAGLVEEAGELMHATLKLKQIGLWGEDGDYTQARLQEKLVDAVGDVAIYACSACNANQWEFSQLVEEAKLGYAAMHLTTMTAARQVVCSAVEFSASNTRSGLRRVLMDLVYFAKDATLDFDDCVARTWAAVKLRSQRPRRPVVVCLCGSTRFKQLWYDTTKSETLAGRIVLGVGDLDTSESNREVNVPISSDRKLMLDELHLRKIEMADEVLVLNGMLCTYCNGSHVEPKFPVQRCYGAELRPYIGESTRREIAHAKSLGKKVRYVNPCE